MKAKTNVMKNEINENKALSQTSVMRSSLPDILDNIKKDFAWIETAFIEDNNIVIEESYDMGDDENNDEDCYDTARENGESIIEKYPMLEISNYYCHRHKYAIVELKLRENFA